MEKPERPKNREVENEMVCPPEKPGQPPRAVTEPKKPRQKPRRRDEKRQ